MRRPLRGWRLALLLTVTVLACGLTARLGLWQLGRAQDKQALQDTMAALERQPPLDARALAAGRDRRALLHRRASLQGQWLSSRTVYLDNRPMAGRTGFYVVTPLQLQATGDVVLVQRGWVPRDFQDRSRLPVVKTDAGPVQVEGRVAPALSRLYELPGADTGAIRHNLEPMAYGGETGLPVLPLVLVQTAGADDGLLRQWPEPAAGVDKHYGYAFQWFGLSALIAFLFIWFQIVRRYLPPRSAS